MGIIRTTLCFGLLFTLQARAASVDVLVGDKDGFGFGCSDSGSCPQLVNPPVDQRSVSEMAATDGSQFTDTFSALYPGFGPNAGTSGDILFPFTGTLTSASIVVSAGEFQADFYGAFAAAINGQPESLNYADGIAVTAIHSFVLTPAELAAANTAQQVILHLDRNGSADYVAFDWFELTGEADLPMTSAPEPGSLALMAAGIAGLTLAGRRIV